MVKIPHLPREKAGSGLVEIFSCGTIARCATRCRRAGRCHLNVTGDAKKLSFPVPTRRHLRRETRPDCGGGSFQNGRVDRLVQQVRGLVGLG